VRAPRRSTLARVVPFPEIRLPAQELSSAVLSRPRRRTAQTPSPTLASATRFPGSHCIPHLSCRSQRLGVVFLPVGQSVSSSASLTRPRRETPFCRGRVDDEQLRRDPVSPPRSSRRSAAAVVEVCSNPRTTCTPSCRAVEKERSRRSERVRCRAGLPQPHPRSPGEDVARKPQELVPAAPGPALRAGRPHGSTAPAIEVLRSVFRRSRVRDCSDGRVLALARGAPVRLAQIFICFYVLMQVVA